MHAKDTIKGSDRNIPRSWAQNLSRSYTDLQQEYQLRKEYFQQRYEADYDDSLDWDDDDDEDAAAADDGSTSSTRIRGNRGMEDHLAVGTSSYYRQQDVINSDEYYSTEEDPKYVLFRHLLREWCVAGGGSGGGGNDNNNDDAHASNDDGDEENTTTNQWPKKWTPNEEGYYENGKIKKVTLMKFPSQIQSNRSGSGLSVRDMIRREFRAPSVEERLRTEEEERSKSNTNERSKPNNRAHPPSSYIDNDIRIQTAFYTLMELNRKLAWAEAIGYPPPTSKSSSSQQQQQRQSSSIQQSTRDELKWKRLVQAAKGVSLFPTPPTAADEPNLTTDANDVPHDIVHEDTSSSSILKCGTFLIAHPLMTGYFAKSVIVILDHAEEDDNKTNSTKTEGEEVEGEESSSGGGGGGGGTYGLIINRLALRPETIETSNQRQQLEMMLRRRQQELGEKGKESETLCTTTHPNVLRSISLLQAINADDLPESVQSAFGDAPVREGGPVNLSLQMIHRKSLSEVASEEEGDSAEEGKGKEECGPASNDIGGTVLGYDHDSKRDAGDAIYFGGDVIKASHAVLNGESDRDDFSFVIGAACWAPGQLQHEIERGCWLPFRGPAPMALTGMCEHNETSIPTAKTANDGENTADNKGITKLSLFPPRPSHPPTGALQEQTTGGQSVTRRPVGDLWLSVMCALGEGEAELAYMMLDQSNVMHALGDACDNFDR